MKPRLQTLDYVVEIAKDWAVAHFAQAQTDDYAVPPHRFELVGAAVVRRAISPNSAEAQSPFDAVRMVRQPTAWLHGTVLTVLTDSESGTAQYEQEAVEILAMDGDEVLVECASVVRISGLPPCIGPFWPCR